MYESRFFAQEHEAAPYLQIYDDQGAEGLLAHLDAAEALDHEGEESADSPAGFRDHTEAVQWGDRVFEIAINRGIPYIGVAEIFLPDPYWDRFDICEAHQVLEWDYHKGGWLHERPQNQKRREATSVQLNRMAFRPAPSLEFDTLSENGMAIYQCLRQRYQLP